MSRTNSLLTQSLLAFLALPGTVAFLVPLALLAPRATDGLIDPRGLAPWAPPVNLVTSGPYRFSRNPMYVAVLLVLAGWAWGFRSSALAIYAVAVMLAFRLRILLHEEPFLNRTHGTGWVRYRAQVPRWL